MLKDLTYKVIVIDDDAEFYEDYTEIIQEVLDEEGYLLIHERYEELDDLNQNTIEDVDLFLVDLKFGNEDKGPEFIKKIRENYLTDILFYSSDSTKISESRSKGEFEGVFYAIRDENKKNIQITLQELLKKMIKRSNTPLATRGIVLGCVAELDSLIKEKIEVLVREADVEFYEELRDKCTKIYYDSYKGASNKINQFLGVDFHKGIKKWEDIKIEKLEYKIEDIVSNIYITDSNKNCRIMKIIYKERVGKDVTYDILGELLVLLQYRNIFAHAQQIITETGEYGFIKSGQEDCLILSEEECKRLRTSIIHCYDNISKIKLSA